MATRILMYSSGLTLGHLRRSHIIAREVLAREPECSILNMVDAAETPFFDRLSGLGHLKLPTTRLGSDFIWRAATLNLSPEDISDLRSEIILEAFREFQPDTVLVDLRPVGVLGELKPLLDQAIQLPQPPKLFLGIRGIDQDPKQTNTQWHTDGAYDYLGHYDAILIYDRPEIYNTGLAYNLIPHARQVIYCNYVASPPECTPLEDTGEAPMILVMGGSGHDVFPMEQAFAEALPLLTEALPLHSVIITGPGMSTQDHDRIVEQAAPYPVRVHRSVADITKLMQRAAAVLTMGGYNSLCEILQLRKKALVVPKTRTTGALDEQEIRTKIFAELGLVRSLHPTELSPTRLAQELLHLIQADDIPNVANIPPMDGAQQVAQLLLGHDNSPSIA
ncbi:MAG: glycosyltransferase family protein [Dehalococcoidia bacterium]